MVMMLALSSDGSVDINSMKRAPGSRIAGAKVLVVATDLSTELKVSPLAQSTGIGWWCGWICVGKMRAEKQAQPSAQISWGQEVGHQLLMGWCSFLLGVKVEHQG